MPMRDRSRPLGERRPTVRRAPPGADASHAVAAIPSELARALARPTRDAARDAHRVAYRFDVARLVRLPGTQDDRPGEARPITGQMQLGAEAAAAAAERVIGRFAGRPVGRGGVTPAAALWARTFEPSRQGTPVWRRQSMPLRIVRGSLNGRPRPGCGGRRGATSAHSASESSCRRTLANLAQQRVVTRRCLHRTTYQTHPRATIATTRLQDLMTPPCRER